MLFPFLKFSVELFCEADLKKTEIRRIDTHKVAKLPLKYSPTAPGKVEMLHL